MARTSRHDAGPPHLPEVSLVVGGGAVQGGSGVADGEVSGLPLPHHGELWSCGVHQQLLQHLYLGNPPKKGGMAAEGHKKLTGKRDGHPGPSATKWEWKTMASLVGQMADSSSSPLSSSHSSLLEQISWRARGAGLAICLHARLYPEWDKPHGCQERKGKRGGEERRAEERRREERKGVQNSFTSNLV